MKSENQLTMMESLFLALADQTRLRLLNLIRENEICVGYFTEVLCVSQPKISRHLAYLRSAGIVSARRSGKWINYKIDFPENPSAARLLGATLSWLESQAEMREDYDKLMRLCADVKALDRPVCAPIPQTFAQTNTTFRQREELDVFLL